MKVRKNCEKYERTVDYFIAATFQIFTALQDQKKKKKKEKEKAQEPHGGDGEIGGTDCIYFPN